MNSPQEWAQQHPQLAAALQEIGAPADGLGEALAGNEDDLAELVGRHALRADQLAALAESVLAAEQARHGHPQTLRRLHQLALALGEQCGQLDELAFRLQRGDRR